jgi:hypothetical protein
MKFLVDEYLTTHSRARDKVFAEQTEPPSEGVEDGPGSPVVGPTDGEENIEDGNDQSGGGIHETAPTPKLVVSGIWSISRTESNCLSESVENRDQGGDILVACEG